MGITIGKVWTIDLISIGIVAEDGRTYYAINRDLNLKYAKKHKWLSENVLSQLPPKQPLYPLHGGSPRIYQESMRWLPMSQIREEIIEFCGGILNEDPFGNHFYTYKNDDLPEFYAYFASYDWVAFCWIFGTMMQLPNGFPKYCRDLKQMIDETCEKLPWYYGRDCWSNTGILGEGPMRVDDRLATFDEKLKKVKELPSYPKQINEHNALDDAIWNFELYKFLQKPFSNFKSV